MHGRVTQLEAYQSYKLEVESSNLSPTTSELMHLSLQKRLARIQEGFAA